MNIEIKFSGQVNDSIQKGDIVYFMPVSSAGGFNTSNTNQATALGPVSDIVVEGNSYAIHVNIGTSSFSFTAQNTFFMFSKDNTVNLASVLGYYAEVQFVNNSKVKSEMFSVGSIAQFNSK